MQLSIGTIFVAWLFMVPLAQAHPVSFQDSLGIMGQHAPILSHNQLNYSLTHRFAVGVHHLRRPDKEGNLNATLTSANFLLKRWNGDHLQANIYAVVGAGTSRLSGQDLTTGMGLLQFDIEDRDYYFLAKHGQFLNEKQTDLAQSVVRFGVAPYQDPYSGIHSWLILEWQNNHFVNEREFSDVTPFLRLFYRNMLFEIGQSYKGLTRFNYIAHF